jgi:hypothetical protein
MAQITVGKAKKSVILLKMAQKALGKSEKGNIIRHGMNGTRKSVKSGDIKNGTNGARKIGKIGCFKKWNK